MSCYDYFMAGSNLYVKIKPHTQVHLDKDIYGCEFVLDRNEEGRLVFLDKNISDVTKGHEDMDIAADLFTMGSTARTKYIGKHAEVYIDALKLYPYSAISKGVRKWREDQKEERRSKEIQDAVRTILESDTVKSLGDKGFIVKVTVSDEEEKGN